MWNSQIPERRVTSPANREISDAMVPAEYLRRDRSVSMRGCKETVHARFHPPVQHSRRKQLRDTRRNQAAMGACRPLVALQMEYRTSCDWIDRIIHWLCVLLNALITLCVYIFSEIPGSSCSRLRYTTLCRKLIAETTQRNLPKHMAVCASHAKNNINFFCNFGIREISGHTSIAVHWNPVRSK